MVMWTCMTRYSLCSLSLMILYGLCMIYRHLLTTDDTPDYEKLFECVAGYGLGGSAIAMVLFCVCICVYLHGYISAHAHMRTCTCMLTCICAHVHCYCHDVACPQNTRMQGLCKYAFL